MTDSCENVKQKLDFFISEMAQNRWLFVNNPQSDFSRQLNAGSGTGNKK